MANIKVQVAGYEAELDIPDDDQVADAARYTAMLTLTADFFQLTANDKDLDEHDRANRLSALSALLLAIIAARDAALPAVSLTLE